MWVYKKNASRTINRFLFKQIFNDVEIVRQVPPSPERMAWNQFERDPFFLHIEHILCHFSADKDIMTFALIKNAA